MRATTAIACATLLTGLSLPAAAAGIVRCESADGHITYSNKECPADTKAVRSVDLSPPVVVHEKGRAPARSGATAGAGAWKAERSGDDPELRAQLAKQRAECDARAKEIDRLRQARDGAKGDAHTAAQKALRRAEEDYRALCPRRR